jgi:hypothetical protein
MGSAGEMGLFKNRVGSIGMTIFTPPEKDRKDATGI